jgi:hypothetical protein
MACVAVAMTEKTNQTLWSYLPSKHRARRSLLFSPLSRMAEIDSSPAVALLYIKIVKIADAVASDSRMWMERFSTHTELLPIPQLGDSVDETGQEKQRQRKPSRSQRIGHEIETPAR